MKTGIPVKIFSIDAIIKVLVRFSSDAHGAKPSLFGSPAGGDEDPLRVFGALGDNINHSIECVSAPKSSTGTTDDFNAIDVFERIILHFPISPRQKAENIDGAAIDQHQHRTIQ